MAARRDKEKEKFDDRHPKELKPLVVGSTMSYLNSDLKTWSVGVIILHSPDNRSYHIKTESDQVISHNRVHLHETNVEFFPQVQNILKVLKVLKEEKTVKSPNILCKSKTSKALLVPMVIIELDLAMKSENHLGIGKS